jgi:hypothetical protein
MRKELIRNNSWDTNSSSCHSISISSDMEVLDTIYPDENGVITIEGRDFGRWFERSNDVNMKLSYAVTSTLYDLSEEILKEIIKEQTGCNEVIFNVSDDWDSPYWSSIDHESVEICPREKEQLRNFLFNKNSWLFIAHDEGTPEPGFYDVLPIYTINGVIEPLFKYELIIPLINKSFKFLDLPNQQDFKNLIDSLKVRYNKTNKIWQTNTHSWSSDEEYYEPEDYLEQDLNNRYILVFNDKKLKDLCYHKWKWEERKERKEVFLKARQNSKYFKKLPFTITEL